MYKKLLEYVRYVRWQGMTRDDKGESVCESVWICVSSRFFTCESSLSATHNGWRQWGRGLRGLLWPKSTQFSLLWYIDTLIHLDRHTEIQRYFNDIHTSSLDLVDFVKFVDSKRSIWLQFRRFRRFRRLLGPPESLREPLRARDSFYILWNPFVTFVSLLSHLHPLHDHRIMLQPLRPRPSSCQLPFGPRMGFGTFVVRPTYTATSLEPCGAQIRRRFGRGIDLEAGAKSCVNSKANLVAYLQHPMGSLFSNPWFRFAQKMALCINMQNCLWRALLSATCLFQSYFNR